MNKIILIGKLIRISDSPLSCFIVSCSVCYSYILRIYGCVFCSLTLLFAFRCMCMTPNPLRECPWAGRFRATLLLRATCTRS